MEKQSTETYHRFLDEAGDTTFYGKGKIPILGHEGVSYCFILGMITINETLDKVRKQVIDLQESISNDTYFTEIPSIQKKKKAHGYFLHAKDDIPEVRKMAFELIHSLDCHFEAIVARKSYDIYEGKHNGKEAEFYADLLSHLLHDKLNEHPRLVLNLAERKKCTTHQNLAKGLERALSSAKSKNFGVKLDCKVVFNVQQPTTEPLLNLADYFCWAIQRVFERGEMRYYNFIKDKIRLIHDIYDFEKGKIGEIYGQERPLTIQNAINKKSPLMH